MAGHALTLPWFFVDLLSHHKRPFFRVFLPGVFSHAGGATGSFSPTLSSSPAAALQKPHVFEHTFFMNLGLLSHLPWVFFLLQNFFLYLPSFFASRLSTHGGSSSPPFSAVAAPHSLGVDPENLVELALGDTQALPGLRNAPRQSEPVLLLAWLQRR